MRFGAIVMMACILPLLGISNLHSATVTVKLIDHNGSLITTGGATLSYHDGSWTNLGTSATGEWSVTSAAGSVTYKMTYNNGSQQIVEPISTDPVIFQTVAVTPALKNSGGTALGGGTVKFHQITWKNWAGAANTADELLPGKYTFKMTYNNGSQQIVETVGGTTHEVLFTTVTVTPSLKDSDGAALAGGTVKFHQITWQNWTGLANTANELLPGKYTFRMTYNNGSQQIVQTVAGTDDEVPFVTVSVTPALKDSDGNLVAGGTVQYHQITWMNWAGAANTVDELLPGKYTFKMTVNNGSQQIVKTVSGTDYEVLFETVTVTPSLKDCDDNALAGGTVQYHQITWANWTNANTPKELLPGKYTFKMTYNNGRQQVVKTVGGNSYEVPFVTTTVDFGYAGLVKYHQIGWQNFTGPQELLPGKYTFKFDNYSQQYDISGCSFEKTAVIFKLLYANGSGAAGAKGYIHHGGWQMAPGTTGSNGILIALFDGVFSGNKKFYMSYESGPGVFIDSKHTYYNISSNPVVEFHLSRVTARLWDGSMSLPTAEGGDLGKLYVHNGGWKYLGMTTNGEYTFDIFAGNRKFRMKDVNYSSRDKYYNVPTGYYNMDWPVVREIVQAKDQSGSLVTDTDFEAWIHYGGWKSLGKDSDDGQDGIIHKGVLAGNHKFRMELSYSSYDKYFNSTIALFKAVRNAVHVKDQCGSYLGIGDYSAKAWVHYGGWKYLGEDSDDGMDGIVPCVLLEGNRKFRMELGPSSYDKYFHIKQTPVYAMFDAVRNPVEVRDQDGNLLPDTEYPVSGKVWVHYGGWKPLPDLSGGVCNTVLLRGNRKFRMEINYSSYDKYFHIKPTGVCTADLAVFEALKDPVNLVDCNNNGIAGGDAWVHYGGWKSLGTTNAAGTIPNMSLLSGNRKFRMKHSGISQDKYIHIKWGAPPTLATFLASTLTLQFSGTIKYNYGGWQTYTGPMVFLAGSYNFTFDGMPK
ncbi:MAG: hypothetical protein CL946_08550, partial [Ectothiorhodospiraceae bacterium]|nr:hypothetical protein [Ectothiorhodospiraceae bacterium]